MAPAQDRTGLLAGADDAALVAVSAALSQARGVIALTILTWRAGCVRLVTGMPLLVVWSGALGLVNLTLTLVITSQPPHVWMALSAGITLLALLDGSQRFAYLRHCHVEAGVLTAWLGVFMRLTGLSLAAGVALVLLGGESAHPRWDGFGRGVLTIVGASLFVGVLALLLLYTSRWPERE